MNNEMLATAGVLAGAFVLFFVAERCLPLRKQQERLWPRLLLNLALSALAYATAALVLKPAVAQSTAWSGTKTIGLLHLVSFPGWIKFVLGFLLMDLSFYYWHVATHKAPLLWRFHNIHHSDPDLDLSTSFRFHFGEILLSVFFRATQVIVLGLSPTVYAAYEIVFQANTFFHHSNIRLPITLEGVLNRFLVTPRMHGIHHSQIREEADSNFGVVFSWWDRLHCSFRRAVSQSRLKVGLPAYSGPDDNRFWPLMLRPFRKQRDSFSRRQRPSTRIRPENAVALGASVQAGLAEQAQHRNEAAPVQPHAAVRSGRGCMVLLAVIVVAVLLLI